MEASEPHLVGSRRQACGCPQPQQRCGLCLMAVVCSVAHAMAHLLSMSVLPARSRPGCVDWMVVVVELPDRGIAVESSYM